MASQEDSKKRKAGEYVTPFVAKDLLKKVVSLLPLDKIAQLLSDAAYENESLRQAVLEEANKNPSNRKIFVRSLGPETTSTSLKESFIEYGPIEEGKVILDKNTQQTRGFGFINFSDVYSCMRALAVYGKTVDGHVVNAQLASVSTAAIQTGEISERRVYVGNVPFLLSADKLHSFFSRYGEIEEGPLGYDKTTGVSRGYAIILFKTVEGAKNALQEPVKTIEGHQVHCRKAIDKHKSAQSNASTDQATEPKPLAASSTANLPSQPFQLPHSVTPAFVSPAPPNTGLIYGNPQTIPPPTLYSAPQATQVFYTQNGEMVVGSATMPLNHSQQPIQFSAAPGGYTVQGPSNALQPPLKHSLPAGQPDQTGTQNAPSTGPNKNLQPPLQDARVQGLPVLQGYQQLYQIPSASQPVMNDPSRPQSDASSHVSPAPYLVSQNGHPVTNPQLVVYPQK